MAVFRWTQTLQVDPCLTEGFCFIFEFTDSVHWLEAVPRSGGEPHQPQRHLCFANGTRGGFASTWVGGVRGTQRGTSFPAKYFVVLKSHDYETSREFPTTFFAEPPLSQFCFRAFKRT